MDYNMLYNQAQKYDEMSAKHSITAIQTKSLSERYKLYRKARLLHNISKNMFDLAEILQKEETPYC